MGMTLAEKILSRHVGRDVKPGEIVLATVDATVSHDSNRPQAAEMFKKLGGKKVFNPNRVAMILDHHYPAMAEANARIHKMMKNFSEEQKCVFYQGEGICHMVIPENGHILPGEILVGTDSHTCTNGAIGAFATGVGSTDMGFTLITGKLWFMVPETIKMMITGKLPAGVFAKDIILHIIATVTAEGATYKAVEFTGPVIEELSMDARFTLCNMAIEMGAKVGMVPPDQTTLDWVKKRTRGEVIPEVPDPDAHYAEVMEFNVSDLTPYVAIPHQVDKGVPIERVLGTPVDQANIVSCTCSRIEDLRIVASILRGRKIAKDMRLMVVPGSRQVLKKALHEKLINIFVDAGGSVGTPNCMGCAAGGHFGVPSDGEVVISTGNRNFKGRLGNPNAFIYLASPATAAATALEGKIADPRPYFTS
jgi:3-isopropylmalate/(R)-2-methylmalate dehydratase large subunit